MKTSETAKPVKVLVVEDNPSDVLLVRMALGVGGGGAFEVGAEDRLGYPARKGGPRRRGPAGSRTA